MKEPMHNPHKSGASLQRVWNTLCYSWDGLRAAFKNEAAFRQEILGAAVLIPLALWLDVSHLSKALLIGSVLLVLIAELFNSAIEAVVDRISLEKHELSKRAKDVGSAAVFISLFYLGVTWLFVLWPDKLHLF